MSHTPGPWKVFETKADDGHVIERMIGTVGEHPQLKGPAPVVTSCHSIQSVNGVTPFHGVHIDEADAALIAAAPDLLAALVALADRVCVRFGETIKYEPVGVGRYLDAAYEAILKARGSEKRESQGAFRPRKINGCSCGCHSSSNTCCDCGCR